MDFKELITEIHNFPIEGINFKDISPLLASSRFAEVINEMGKLVEKPLRKACDRLNAIKGMKLNLYGLASPYWGQEKVVTGLLTGQDLIEGLRNCNLGEQLLLPSITLKPDKPIFLDDMHLKEVEDSLGVPICIVDGADEIVSAAIRDFASTP